MSSSKIAVPPDPDPAKVVDFADFPLSGSSEHPSTDRRERHRRGRPQRVVGLRATARRLGPRLIVAEQTPSMNPKRVMSCK